MNFHSLLVVTLSLILFAIGCENDENSTAPKTTPELWISSITPDFGSEETTKYFTIENSGDGILEWSIITNQDWLVVSPLSGSNTDDTDSIMVTVNRDFLSTGFYSGMIYVSSNGGIKTILVSMNVGTQIWSYYIMDNSDLDNKWLCYDDTDGGNSGADYWGVVPSDAPTGNFAVWCAGRGVHAPNLYDNDMKTWMVMKTEETINIRDYTDISIKFWMKYETETDADYVKFLVKGMDGNWYFIYRITRWSGGDHVWHYYDISLSWFQHAPLYDLRIAFIFESNASNCYHGASISDIEVWGR